MEETNDRSIRKWIEENSSVSAVAADLNLSRPTIYKYVDKFDKGDVDKLPESVVAYFEQKLTPKDDPKLIRMKMNLEDESLMMASRIKMEKARLSELLLKRDEVVRQISVLEKSPNDDADASESMKKMKIELEVLSKEYMVCSESLHKAEERLDELEAKLAELENVKFVPSNDKPIFKIKSSCFIENGKCMVVHTGEESLAWDPVKEEEPRLYYRLHLYAKIGNEYAHLGEYKPVESRNFFIIDDVFLSAPLYYNIVSCVADPTFDRYDLLEPGEDPPLIEIFGTNSTGICELKRAGKPFFNPHRRYVSEHYRRQSED